MRCYATASRLPQRKVPMTYESPQICHTLTSAEGGCPLESLPACLLAWATRSTPTLFLFMPRFSSHSRAVLAHSQAHLTLFVSLACALFFITTEGAEGIRAQICSGGYLGSASQNARLQKTGERAGNYPRGFTRVTLLGQSCLNWPSLTWRFFISLV